MTEEQIEVAMRLRGATEYQRQMGKSAAVTTEYGAAAERAGAQAKAGAVGIDAMSASSKKGVGSLAKMKKVGTGMKSIGRGISTYVSLPVIAAGVYAVHTAAEFQKSMAQVKVAGHVGGEGMGTLEDLALEMGAKTIFSANESAEAMLALTKSGIGPAKIEAGALASTMSLAATEGLALGHTAEIVGASMNTFGIQAKKSREIADALAGGANASSASVGGLAQSLAQGGQSAAMYGVNIHETVGALAAFAQNGIQASDAGTSFKTFMMRLNPTQKKQKELMEELNLSFFNQRGEMVGLTQVAKKLGVALAGKNQQERGAILQTIFGSDATRAANIIYKEGAKGLQHYIVATEKQGGAQRMANAQMKGLPGSIERLKGSLETAALVAGQAMAPAITFLAGKIEWLANAFTSLPPQVQTFIVVGLAVVAILGPLVWIVGSLIIAGTALVPVISWLAASFVALDISMAGIPLLIGAVAAVAVGLSGVFSGASSKTNALAKTTDNLTGYMEGQRTAGKNLVNSEHHLTKAKDRHKSATKSFKIAQGHLTAVVQEYGRRSKPALRAEQMLAQKRWGVVRATRAVKNAEREHGIAKQMTMQLTKSAVLEARHEINQLQAKKNQFDKLFITEQNNHASAERMNQVAEWGSKVNDRLHTSHKKLNEIILEASQKIGPKYAKFLTKAKRESVEFGTSLKGVTNEFKQLIETSKNMPSAVQQSTFHTINPHTGKVEPVGPGGEPLHPGGGHGKGGPKGRPNTSVGPLRNKGGPTPYMLDAGRQNGSKRPKGGTQVPVQANFYVGRRKFGEAMAMAMIDEEVNE